jgi:hypothetical protein
MKECSLCSSTDKLIQCPNCKQFYCKIHYSFHKNNSSCKKALEEKVGKK